MESSWQDLYVHHGSHGHLTLVVIYLHDGAAHFLAARCHWESIGHRVDDLGRVLVAQSVLERVLSPQNVGCSSVGLVLVLT